MRTDGDPRNRGSATTGDINYTNVTRQYAKLLGAETILAGLRPAVAATLVGMGADLSAISSVHDAQEALRRCMLRTSKR